VVDVGSRVGEETRAALATLAAATLALHRGLGREEEVATALRATVDELDERQARSARENRKRAAGPRLDALAASVLAERRVGLDPGDASKGKRRRIALLKRPPGSGRADPMPKGAGALADSYGHLFPDARFARRK
jgi:hypothetical protein